MFGKFRRLLLFLVGLTFAAEHLGGFRLGATVFGVNKIVTILLLAFAMVQFMVRRDSFPANQKNAWVLFYAASVGVSTVYAAIMGVNWAVLAASTVTSASLILYYFLLTYIVRDETDLEALLKGLVWSGLLVSVTSLLGIGMEVADTEYGERSGGFGGNVNEFAFNATIAMVIAFGSYGITRLKLSRLFYIGASLVMLMAIVKSLSRATWL